MNKLLLTAIFNKKEDNKLYTSNSKIPNSKLSKEPLLKVCIIVNASDSKNWRFRLTFLAQTNNKPMVLTFAIFHKKKKKILNFLKRATLASL